jgi:hypothetical protein
MRVMRLMQKLDLTTSGKRLRPAGRESGGP